MPFSLDGSVLLEIFTHDGVGTMVVEDTLDDLRPATLDDVGAILSLIEPLEADGTLVPRPRSVIERDVENFTVLEHDGVIYEMCIRDRRRRAASAPPLSLTRSDLARASRASCRS